MANYRPLLITTVVAIISLLLTLVNGQLTVDKVDVESVSVSGPLPCVDATYSNRPYLSCDGGETSVAEKGDFVAQTDVFVDLNEYDIFISRVVRNGGDDNEDEADDANHLSIDTDNCAVYIRLPLRNCAAFPQTSGLIKAVFVMTIGSIEIGVGGSRFANYRTGEFKQV